MAGLGRTRFALISPRTLLLLTLAIGASVALALDQPDQLVTGKKLLIKTDANDTSKNKLVFVSKDTSFDLPNLSNDPTVNGAVLRVKDLGGTAGSITLSLPASRWSTIGGGFKYKGQPGDPCKTIKIKDDKLIKIVCKGASVNLSPPFSGAPALGLTVGTASVRYCATFTGTPSKNEVKPNGKGSFKKTDVPAPVACLSCGDGTVDAGEQCDDGNNLDGDCCSAACTFETNGSPCTDGNACTGNDVCNGAGACGGGPVCGNDVLEAGCGEQCDGTADGACPDRCQADCTCLPLPTCDADPSRVLYAGDPGSGACHAYDDNQVLCEQAFHLGGGGVASCFYDTDTGECRGCGPSNQAEGLCMNSCRPVDCIGDPTRTMFAGGPQSGACQNYGLIAGTANCELAFHVGQYGVATCYYDSDADECRGCGPQNQADGNCVNTCAACAEDPSRTVFLGGPQTSACHELDGNQAACEQAFHKDQCGHPTSCYYDVGSDECLGCGPSNLSDGLCRNTCATGPVTCTNDPSRTIDAGGPETAACHQFDGDAATCQQAFHRSAGNQTTSCYYDFSNDECRGCGPNNEFNNECINTCVAGPVTCAQDPSRTMFAGMPNSQACQEFGLSAGTAACETAFHIGQGGVASCYMDGVDCRGCGPGNESSGECQNTCTQGPPSCSADPTRTIYAGGPNTQACHQFDGDQTSCEQAFHRGQSGIASCYYSFGDCLGCGPSNQSGGECTNTCNPASCPGDVTRTIFAGGPQNSACHFFDGNQVNCEKAYHLGSDGTGIFVSSCYYDTDDDECRGCGASNQDAGECVNTCPVCQNDPSRTVFTGGPGPTTACELFSGNQAACETAFQYDDYGHATSCYFVSGDCEPCDLNNFGNGECQNTCVVGPPTCQKDATRTIFAGGPQTGACQQFDGDPVSCLKAFHRGQYGGIASCFYESFGDNCTGCGPGQSGGDCLNTCQHGVPACTQDPTRTLFAGYPNSSACHVFDNNQAGCQMAYHLDQAYNAASCYYDSDTGDCNGCGPNHQQNGDCLNTCASGPASCDGDSSRVLFGGGPETGACQNFLTEASCLAAFHVGQCGVASCFWDGSCRGCGPNNEGQAECFNTCQAPQ